MASVIMENPFYAARKPKRQNYSGLRKWIDLLSLSMGVALEGNALRQWLVERNIKTVGFTGISLGGHLAAICASSCPEPVPCVPAYCWSSSAGVWTRGALSQVYIVQCLPGKAIRRNYVAREFYTTDWRLYIESG